MAQCKYCGRSGWFLALTANGLCNNCNPIVSMDVIQRARIINDSLKLVRESKKLDTQLSRCDLIVEHASALMKYEQLGIPTLNPLPSAFVQEYQAMHDQIIVDGLTTEFENARSKAEVAPSVTSKVNLLSKALLKVREYKLKANNPSILDSLEQQISQLIQNIQLAGYLDAARKAEFKGQKKKALDQYYEALYFLKHDDINDSFQQEHISLIESKIAELGGSAILQSEPLQGEAQGGQTSSERTSGGRTSRMPVWSRQTSRRRPLRVVKSMGFPLGG